MLGVGSAQQHELVLKLLLLFFAAGVLAFTIVLHFKHQTLGAVAFQEVVPIEMGGTGSRTSSDLLSNMGIGDIVFSSVPVKIEHGGTGAKSHQEVRDMLAYTWDELGVVEELKGSKATLHEAKIESVGTGISFGSLLLENTAGVEPLHGDDLVTQKHVMKHSKPFRVLERVATSTSAALTATYDNGANGVGATLTASANGALTCGGVAFVPGDEGARVLVSEQVNAIQNGVYTVTAVGDGASPWVLTRAADLDGSPGYEARTGVVVQVTDGDNGGIGFVLSTPDGDLSNPPFVSLANGANEPLRFFNYSINSLTGVLNSISLLPASMPARTVPCLTGGYAVEPVLASVTKIRIARTIALGSGTAQTVSVDLALDTVDDPLGVVNPNGSNGSHFQNPAASVRYWAVSFLAAFAIAADGYRRVAIRHTRGSDAYVREVGDSYSHFTGAPAVASSKSTSGIFEMYPDDVLQVIVMQTSGFAINAGPFEISIAQLPAAKPIV